MSSINFDRTDADILNNRRKKKPIGKIYKEDDDQGKSEYESFYENLSGDISLDMQKASGKLQLEGGGRNKSSQKKSANK